MLRFILIMLSILTLGFSSTYRDELKRLTVDQKQVLLFSLKAGKEKDLGITLAAIAWKESSFGVNRSTPTDGKFGSFGSYHVLLSTAANHIKNMDLPFTYNHKSKTHRNLLRFVLTYVDRIGAKLALAELEYWNTRHKGDYTKMIASYNAGNAGIHSPAGAKYMRDLKYRVRLLQEYVVANDIKY